MKKIKLFREFLFMLTVTLAGSPLYTNSYAQSLGNPVFLKKNAWSVAAGADIQTYDFDAHNYKSVRGIFKVDFAVTEYVNAAFYVGSANLTIKYPVSRSLEDFEARNSIAFGASLKTVHELGRYEKFKVFGEGGFYKFNADGITNQIGDTEDIFLDFVWDELWVSSGIFYAVNTIFDVYAGVQGRAIIQNEKESNKEFTSGVKPSIITGVQLNLPQNYKISLQIRALNGGAVSIGMSQTAAIGNN